MIKLDDMKIFRWQTMSGQKNVTRMLTHDLFAGANLVVAHFCTDE